MTGLNKRSKCLTLMKAMLILTMFSITNGSLIARVKAIYFLLIAEKNKKMRSISNL